MKVIESKYTEEIAALGYKEIRCEEAVFNSIMRRRIVILDKGQEVKIEGYTQEDCVEYLKEGRLNPRKEDCLLIRIW